MEHVHMGKRKGNRFSPEFKAEAVELVEASGKSVAELARDLGLSEQSLHRWIKQAKVDRGDGPKGALTTAEHRELRELRRKVKQLEMEREILKKATVFFAKENQ